jgi:hypothetical protein
MDGTDSLIRRRLFGSISLPVRLAVAPGATVDRPHRAVLRSCVSRFRKIWVRASRLSRLSSCSSTFRHSRGPRPQQETFPWTC